MQNVRALAASALATVVRDGRAFDGSIDFPRDSAARTASPPADSLDVRDRALFRELCYGTLRQYFLLNAVLLPKLKKPLGKRDSDLQALLLLGLYQLLFMRTPDHAAIATCVEACKTLNKAWARGLVNAILRAVQRDIAAAGRDAVLACDKASAAARAAHPEWLYHKLMQDWPDHWQQLVDYNNAAPPMAIRVDLAQHSRDAWLAELPADVARASPVDFCDSAVVLENPVDPQQLPGFASGLASIQDSGAQLAAILLDAQSGHRVLDACAAPGGKALHIVQRNQDVELLALDLAAARLARVEENLARAGIAVDGSRIALQAADALAPDTWWDGRCFDRILLDAPCSGSGVIAHHPDIKLLRRAADIETLALTQQQMLQALWPTLATGGELLYCTCSVLRAENEAVIQHFIGTEDSAALKEIAGDWGEPCAAGRQLLPKKGSNDGFFYARLRKLPAP